MATDYLMTVAPSSLLVFFFFLPLRNNLVFLPSWRTLQKFVSGSGAFFPCSLLLFGCNGVTNTKTHPLFRVNHIPLTMYSLVEYQEIFGMLNAVQKGIVRGMNGPMTSLSQLHKQIDEMKLKPPSWPQPQNRSSGHCIMTKPPTTRLQLRRVGCVIVIHSNISRVKIYWREAWSGNVLAEIILCLCNHDTWHWATLRQEVETTK